MQEQLPRASVCQKTGIGRHVEVERDVVFGDGVGNQHDLVVIEDEWLPAACELPVDLGEKGVYSS